MDTERHVTFRLNISTFCLLVCMLCYTAYISALILFVSHEGRGWARCRERKRGDMVEGAREGMGRDGIPYVIFPNHPVVLGPRFEETAPASSPPLLLSSPLLLPSSLLLSRHQHHRHPTHDTPLTRFVAP